MTEDKDNEKEVSINTKNNVFRGNFGKKPKPPAVRVAAARHPQPSPADPGRRKWLKKWGLPLAGAATAAVINPLLLKSPSETDQKEKEDPHNYCLTSYNGFGIHEQSIENALVPPTRHDHLLFEPISGTIPLTRSSGRLYIHTNMLRECDITDISITPNSEGKPATRGAIWELTNAKGKGLPQQLHLKDYPKEVVVIDINAREIRKWPITSSRTLQELTKELSGLAKKLRGLKEGHYDLPPHEPTTDRKDFMDRITSAVFRDGISQHKYESIEVGLTR